MSKKIEMIVKMQVTPSQGLALQAMFEYWNQLSKLGGSRKVAFYCDGDGNFHPNCTVSFSEKVPELTAEMKKAVIVEDKCGNRVYDFDPIAWLLRKEEEKPKPNNKPTMVSMKKLSKSFIEGFLKMKPINRLSGVKRK